MIRLGDREEMGVGARMLVGVKGSVWRYGHMEGDLGWASRGHLWKRLFQKMPKGERP